MLDDLSEIQRFKVTADLFRISYFYFDKTVGAKSKPDHLVTPWPVIPSVYLSMWRWPCSGTLST